jgi:Mg2+-importing ATPase
VFDYATFGLLWFFLGTEHNPAQFQTGWFVESLLSQTLIVYVIRTSSPLSFANRPALPLVVASLLVCGTGLWLPWSPLAPVFGFAPAPPSYLWGLVLILAAYAIATQAVKSWLIRRFGIA